MNNKNDENLFKLLEVANKLGQVSTNTSNNSKKILDNNNQLLNISNNYLNKSSEKLFDKNDHQPFKKFKSILSNKPASSTVTSDLNNNQLSNQHESKIGLNNLDSIYANANDDLKDYDREFNKIFKLGEFSKSNKSDVESLDNNLDLIYDEEDDYDDHNQQSTINNQQSTLTKNKKRKKQGTLTKKIGNKIYCQHPGCTESRKFKPLNKVSYDSARNYIKRHYTSHFKPVNKRRKKAAKAGTYSKVDINVVRCPYPGCSESIAIPPETDLTRFSELAKACAKIRGHYKTTHMERPHVNRSKSKHGTYSKTIKHDSYESVVCPYPGCAESIRLPDNLDKKERSKLMTTYRSRITYHYIKEHNSNQAPKPAKIRAKNGTYSKLVGGRRLCLQPNCSFSVTNDSQSTSRIKTHLVQNHYLYVFGYCKSCGLAYTMYDSEEKHMLDSKNGVCKRKFNKMNVKRRPKRVKPDDDEDGDTYQNKLNKYLGFGKYGDLLGRFGRCGKCDLVYKVSNTKRYHESTIDKDGNCCKISKINRKIKEAAERRLNNQLKREKKLKKQIKKN